MVVATAMAALGCGANDAAQLTTGVTADAVGDVTAAGASTTIASGAAPTPPTSPEVDSTMMSESPVTTSANASSSTTAVVPTTAAPENQLVVDLPNDAVRGVMWLLDRAEDDGTWTQVYAINTNPEGAIQRVYRLGEEPYAAPDVTVRGPGPDVVDIPDDIEPGTWRACPTGIDLGCVEFDIAVSGDTRALDVTSGEFSGGRSYVAVTERNGPDIRVGIDYPANAGGSGARIEALRNGNWVLIGDADPVDAGRFVLAADRIGDDSARLCLARLPPSVACVLLPQR